jgi:hypothetical protein
VWESHAPMRLSPEWGGDWKVQPSWTGELRKNGLYIMITAPSLIIAAAKTLAPKG